MKTPCFYLAVAYICCTACCYNHKALMPEPLLRKKQAVHIAARESTSGALLPFMTLIASLPTRPNALLFNFDLDHYILSFHQLVSYTIILIPFAKKVLNITVTDMQKRLLNSKHCCCDAAQGLQPDAFVQAYNMTCTAVTSSCLEASVLTGKLKALSLQVCVYM
jgi:hypothetical protein